MRRVSETESVPDMPPEESARRMVSVTPRIGPDVVSRPADARARSIVSVMFATSKDGTCELERYFMEAFC